MDEVSYFHLEKKYFQFRKNLINGRQWDKRTFSKSPPNKHTTHIKNKPTLTRDSNLNKNVKKLRNIIYFFFFSVFVGRKFHWFYALMLTYSFLPEVISTNRRSFLLNLFFPTCKPTLSIIVSAFQHLFIL